MSRTRGQSNKNYSWGRRERTPARDSSLCRHLPRRGVARETIGAVWAGTRLEALHQGRFSLPLAPSYSWANCSASFLFNFLGGQPRSVLERILSEDRKTRDGMAACTRKQVPAIACLQKKREKPYCVGAGSNTLTAGVSHST